MIFRIDPGFINSCPPARLSDIACAAARNGHYLRTDRNSRSAIRDAVRQHGSTTEKQRFKAHTSMFDPAGNLGRFLRTIEITKDYSPNAFFYLVAGNARLILENANHEWKVYKYFIDLYSNHRELGDCLRLLRYAKEKKTIKAVHSGGWGEMLKIADSEPLRHDGENLRLLKTCMVFDRDTDNSITFDGNKNGLFSRLAGKKADILEESDIYHLDFGSPMWHMWHKRTIENYFPDSRYENIGCDVSAMSGLTPLQRDYFKICEKSVNGYDKHSLDRLIEGLDRNMLEANLKKFRIGDKEYSEMELFLLKLVKII